jgi:hypothetical protein
MTDLVTGTWRCRAIAGSQQFGMSGNGNEQIAIGIEFTDGPNKSRRAVWYGSFTEATEDRTIESLRYLGWSNDDFTNMEGLGSLEAEAVLEEEVGQDGKARIRVRWINRARGPMFKDALDDNRLKAFSARMKGKAVAKRQELESKGVIPKPGQRPAQQRGDEPPPHSDADFGLD